ncbi:hypothetical protein CLV60_101617 [Dyadobacter jiangsuensis]|uniref:Uncharacterized protein n=1 Tax=Dyadobacter jiangsuensis TaxID=1591085 RepID=A0A2P8GJW0_9BACT|nr:hypothetical protein CLV60_101617 [Dyadobacter jiangsuensis]
MFTNTRTKKSKVPNAGFAEPNARFGRKNENQWELFTEPLFEVGHAVAAHKHFLRGGRGQFQL